MFSRLTLLLLLFSCLSMAEESTRFFVSTAGTLLEAEVVAASASHVTLKKKEDGRDITLARTTLCKEDQVYLDAWITAHPDAPKPMAAASAATTSAQPRFSLTSTIRASKSNRGAADGGMRSLLVSYTVELQNREVKRALTGAKGIILTFAKEAGTGTGDNRLYLMQKVEFPVELTAQAKMEQKTPDVALTYYQGDGYRDGARDHGYLFLVQDAAGNVIHADSSPTGMEKHAKEALSLTAPCVLDRDLKVMPNASMSSGINLAP